MSLKAVEDGCRAYISYNTSVSYIHGSCFVISHVTVFYPLWCLPLPFLSIIAYNCDDLEVETFLTVKLIVKHNIHLILQLSM